MSEAVTSAPATPVAQARPAVAVVLSFAAGATDAFAFLQLGGIFTANMTGNLILVGLFQRPGYTTTLIGATVAVIVFALVAYLGFRLTLSRVGPSRGARLLLITATVVQVAVLAGYALTDRPLERALLCVFIALSSVAMACQTVIGRTIEARSGVTTTFVTGTLTSLMQNLANGKRDFRTVRTLSIVALVGGALSGALAVATDPLLGAALPLVPSLVALALLATRR
ncbi:YoaK family protein [Actinoplanes sp. Pm04-4]|uniref:YoaK family protein n=1 Tax=Paractinoplanes pyxinae TaxID=2997416 RepID=A0ABT4B2U9_9ACTN|nr:YoaK family protein [Actinoplanes pyxinae]MCY1140821.1 YoaK family protein [Actinoplanes pyxinae]